MAPACLGPAEWFAQSLGARRKRKATARALVAAPIGFFTNPMLTARYYAPPARDLLGAPHKPTEKFRPVPPIASTIDHTGETRLGARDQPCIRPAIGTQTPWHDSCWLQLSLGDLPQKHFLRRCNRSAIFEGIGS